MAAEPPGQELTDEDRLLLVFGYLGPLALVALVATRREFVKWHAKQGLALFATLAALYPLLRFVRYLIDRWLWSVFGELFRAALWLAVVGGVVTMLLCIIRALEGERFRLPVLGEIADKL